MKDLIKPIDQMSDEELLDRVRDIRHRREVVRPASRVKVERAEKKTSRAAVKRVDGLLDSLSEDERLKLIAMLSQGE